MTVGTEQSSTPHVRRIPHVFSEEECASLVRLLENESTEWDRAPDTVDRNPVFQQTIAYTAGYAGPAKRDVVAPHCFVYKPEIYKLVERACEEHIFSAIAREFKTPRSGLVLNWAYVRRYDPEYRPGLREHTDITDITVNIPLAHLPDPDDKRLYVFTGEESRSIAKQKIDFFARAQNGEVNLEAASANEEEWYELFQLRHQPRELWDRKFRQMYSEDDLLARTVTTHQGEAVMHPGSFNHGVLPISMAKRYSLLLFVSIDGGLQWGRYFVPQSIKGWDIACTKPDHSVSPVTDDDSCWEAASKEEGIMAVMGW
eukprot:CAMPEP_0114225512 /NCGR_PEP_ID=MMETSP0058-20121206/708_1 /TAXON_ID=36894 /ORGANISM="Pyramimonas parkeae, CCMP726" /LENGTH=313 /DNA_ID=CAMNT_0001336115 /DNA_START=105 /DNA_END=1043 /DNA_ORIENTATION=+